MIATVIAGYGVLVRGPGVMHLDHIPFAATLTRMRQGQGYYPAFRDSFVDMDVRLGGPRSFRQPLPFLAWRWIPEGLLYPAFLLVVVGVTCLLLLRLTDRPWAVLPVAVFLLVAGRNPAWFDLPADDWLLVEFWTIPLLAASSLAWRRARWGVASGTLAAACLVRELALPALLAGLLLAHRRGLPRRPWLIGLGAAAGGMALHVTLALQVGVPRGNESNLFGTGHPPESVLKMLLFNLDAPRALGVLVWAMALVRISQVRVEPVTVLLCIPVLGLFVDRPYWGLMITPFVVLAAGELGGARFHRIRRRLTATGSPAASAAIALPPGGSTDVPSLRIDLLRHRLTRM